MREAKKADMAKFRHKYQKPGTGNGWLITFADLMSLLLTFFILLLSFSELDADKYKAIAASMAASFGVSWIQGTPPSVIVLSSVPPPTPSVVTQPVPSPSPAPTVIEMPSSPPPPNLHEEEAVGRLAEYVAARLIDELESNTLTMRRSDQGLVLQFSDSATFEAGDDSLRPEMLPVLEKVAYALAQCDGDIIVAGYTDDIPIHSDRFRSNWDLSASRAISVVHELLKSAAVDPERVMARGHGDTHPIAPNSSPESRALNRRVEIHINHPVCDRVIQF